MNNLFVTGKVVRFSSPRGDEMQRKIKAYKQEIEYPSPHGDEMQPSRPLLIHAMSRIRPRMGMRCNNGQKETRSYEKLYPSPHGDEMQLNRAHQYIDTDIGIRPRMGMRCNNSTTWSRLNIRRIRPRMGMRCNL